MSWTHSIIKLHVKFWNSVRVTLHVWCQGLFSAGQAVGKGRWMWSGENKSYWNSISKCRNPRKGCTPCQFLLTWCGCSTREANISFSELNRHLTQESVWRIGEGRTVTGWTPCLQGKSSNDWQCESATKVPGDSDLIFAA